MRRTEARGRWRHPIGDAYSAPLPRRSLETGPVRDPYEVVAGSVP